MGMACSTRQTHLLPWRNVRALSLTTPQGYGEDRSGQALCPMSPPVPDVVRHFKDTPPVPVLLRSSLAPTLFQELGPEPWVSATWASGRHSRGLCVISWRPSAHRGCWEGRACNGPTLLGTQDSICGKASACCPSPGFSQSGLCLTWRALHFAQT